MSNEVEVVVKAKDDTKDAFAAGGKQAETFGDKVSESSERASTKLAKTAIVVGGVSDAVESAGGIFNDFINIQREAEDRAAEHAQALLDVEQAEADAEQAARDLEQATIDLAQAQIDGKQAALDIGQAHIDEKQAALDVAEAKRDLAEAVKENGKGSMEARQAALDLTQAEQDQKQATEDVKQAKLDKKQATEDAKQAEEDATQATLDAKQATLDESTAKTEASRTTSGFAAAVGTATTVLSSAVSTIGLGVMAHQALAGSTAASTIATKVATVATKAWSVAAKGAAIATRLLGVAVRFALGPVGLIITGIGALIAIFVVIEKRTGFFSKAWKVAWNAIKNAAAAAFNWVKKNWPLLLAIITGPIGLAVLAVTKNWDRIKNGARAAKDFVADRFGELVGFFRRLPGRIKSVFTGLANILTAPYRTAFGAIKRLWNSTVAGFSFTVPDWIPKVGGKGFSIPQMAHGGITGGLVSVGERGRELVRLPSGSQVIPNGQTERMLSGGGGRGEDVTVVHLMLDLEVLETAVIRRARDGRGRIAVTSA